MATDFSILPDPPDALTPGTALARLVDGIGFRLHWALEGLRPEDHDFAPTPEAMTIRQIVSHILSMMQWIDGALGGAAGQEPPQDFEALRSMTLTRLQALRDRLAGMSTEDLEAFRIVRPQGEYPTWNVISGPLADALTHVGQINTCRRINGNPTPRVNYFSGERPAGGEEISRRERGVR
ncbi:DinB family protein [Candidatus Sumerlaeota bacterium]|nr:DinB family protein [Candidatus Sumerlaeota bacterium]